MPQNRNVQILLLASILSATAAAAIAAETIEGRWKTAIGDTAEIGPCPQGYCIVLKNGKYAGKQIGALNGKDGVYTGQVTDPADDKTYEGSATVNGNALKLEGCVWKIFCKAQVWTRL